MNLHALAAQVVRDSLSPDPADMAKDLVALIEPSDYEEALTFLARDIIRTAIHVQRSTGPTPAPAQGSARVAAVRSAWQQALDTPEFVPSAGWVFLKEATREQVLEMARVRFEKADELTKAATRYKAIAAAMRKASVMRVSDLPAETLASLLGGDVAA